MEPIGRNKRIAGAIAAILVAVFFLGVLVSALQARANIFGDFYNSYIAPLLGGSTGTVPSGGSANPVPGAAEPKNGAPLYQPVIDYEQAVVNAVKKASPAVVSITISKNVPIIEQCPYSPFGDLPPEFQQFFGDQYPQFSQPCQKGTKLQEVGGGSGFIISSDGMILTNRHVAGDKTASYTVFTNDGKKYDAKILAVDPTQDLAVLKIDASGLPTVALGDSDSLELGQTAIAIGNALGEFRNTVSVGVISGLARTVTAGGAGIGEETIQGVIQTDAAINPGNSGGPLLNLRGEVIGINTAIAQGAQNVGFAIPINQAKRDINSVKSTGEIRVPYIGVRYITITSEIAKSQKLPVENGALVRGSSDGPAVAPDSPAAKARLLSPEGVANGGQAGIQAEDIILAVNGKNLDESNALGNAISKFNVGDTITLKINRGGKEMTVSVTLAKRPTQ